MTVPITLVFAAILFALDLVVPSGLGEWGMYLIPLLLSFRARQWRYPLVFAGICTVLLIPGYFLSEVGFDAGLVAINRSVGIAVLWITAILLVQRKRSEQALKDNEGRLRAILDHSPLAIFTKDTSGRYTEFNRQCEIVSQHTRATAIGKTDAELFPKEIGDVFAVTDQAVLETGKAATGENQFPNQHEMRSHLVIKFPLLDADGKCNAIGGISADITDLKRAEQALRQNQERLDLAQKAGRIGTFDWFVPTGEVIWSPALESLYGMTPGSFGRTYEAWRQAVHPEDRSRAEAELHQAIASLSELNHEFRNVWPDGSIHWMRCAARVFNNEAGELERVIGINIDITESKRVQQELALSNERLGLIARATAAIVGAAPLAEECRKLAEQVRKAFGVDACVIRILEGDELVLLASAGIPEESLQPRLSADLGVPGGILSSRRPLFVPDVPLHVSTSPDVFQWPIGFRYTSYAGAPLLAQDRIIGILGIYSRLQLESFPETDLEHLQIIANDVAVAIVNDRLFKEVQSQKDQLAEQIRERKRVEEALRESESRFRAISEQSLMGIYIIQEGGFSYVNPKFEEIFGYTRAELLALPSVVEVIVEEDRSQMQENMRRRLAGEIKGLRFQSHGLRKDGSVITIEAHGTQTELDGKTAILGTVQDISEREQAEAVLKRTTEQLQTLSRRLLELQEVERRHIARELHDEIGQALTALKINLQAVQRMADAATFAPRLLDSISIVDRTLRQVRNLSLDLRPSMLDDLGLCAALRWYADQQAQRAGLSIQFDGGDLGGRLDPTLETACFRVAQEALTNIVRHAQASSVLVRLKTEGATLHLTVRDDGIGFDLHGLHPQSEHGSSLGLLGIEERASLLGGRIELISAPQQGTEVHAWFPLAAAPAQPEPENDLVEKR